MELTKFLALTVVPKPQALSILLESTCRSIEVKFFSASKLK